MSTTVARFAKFMLCIRLIGGGSLIKYKDGRINYAPLNRPLQGSQSSKQKLRDERKLEKLGLISIV